ncbi:protein of unknown function [Ruminococcaceae bacterium BL-4]|nr:protein of unknown function [Ruminococcaceae bacterium BL-4]
MYIGKINNLLSIFLELILGMLVYFPDGYFERRFHKNDKAYFDRFGGADFVFFRDG